MLKGRGVLPLSKPKGKAPHRGAREVLDVERVYSVILFGKPIITAYNL
jgi:hypothetical protein